MRKAVISILASLLLLTGCSTFHPHQLSVQPLHPAVNQDLQLPASLKIEIQSQDLRSSGLIGFRISRLSDRAEVNLPLPVAEALREGVKAGVVKLGATPATTADTKLKVVLNNLEYQATQGALQTVRLTAAISVTAEKYDQSYSGNYGTDKEHQFAATPDLKDNQRIVNDILLQTLSRAFNDPQLINFLKQP